MKVSTVVAALASVLALGCEGEDSTGQRQAPVVQSAVTVPALPPRAKPEDPGSRRSSEAMVHKPAKTPPAAKVLSQRDVDVMMKGFAERAAQATPKQLQAEHEAQEPK